MDRSLIPGSVWSWHDKWIYVVLCDDRILCLEDSVVENDHDCNIGKVYNLKIHYRDSIRIA